MKLYAESQANVNVHAVHQGVLNQKGSKQVRNLVHNQKKKVRISKDEMHATVLVAHQLGDYVRNYTLFLDFECVIRYIVVVVVHIYSARLGTPPHGVEKRYRV